MKAKHLYLSLITGFSTVGILGIAVGVSTYLYSRMMKSHTMVLHFCTNFKKNSNGNTTSKEMQNKTLLIASSKQNTLKKIDSVLYAVGPEIDYMRTINQGKCLSQLASSRREMFCQSSAKSMKKGTARSIRYVSEPRLSVTEEDRRFFLDKETEILSLPTIKDYAIKALVVFPDLSIKWKCYWLSQEDKTLGDFNEKFQYESFTLFRARRDKSCTKETLSSLESDYYIVKLQIKDAITFIVTENEEWALSRDLNLGDFKYKIADQRTILQYEEISCKRQEFYELIGARVRSQVSGLASLIKALTGLNKNISQKA